MSAVLVAGCFSCEQERLGERAPRRERFVLTDHWRVAHAFDSSLPGWLVLAARRHVLALDELAPGALVELGPLAGRLTAALRAAVGCTRTYLMQFSEAEGFAHLHVHLVPRMPDQDPAERGPGCFARLGVPEAERVPLPRVDALVEVLAEQVRQPGTKDWPQRAQPGTEWVPRLGTVLSADPA